VTVQRQGMPGQKIQIEIEIEIEKKTACKADFDFDFDASKNSRPVNGYLHPGSGYPFSRSGEDGARPSGRPGRRTALFACPV